MRRWSISLVLNSGKRLVVSFMLQQQNWCWLVGLHCNNCFSRKFARVQCLNYPEITGGGWKLIVWVRGERGWHFCSQSFPFSMVYCHSHSQVQPYMIPFHFVNELTRNCSLPFATSHSHMAFPSHSHEIGTTIPIPTGFPWTHGIGLEPMRIPEFPTFAHLYSSFCQCNRLTSAAPGLPIRMQRFVYRPTSWQSIISHHRPGAILAPELRLCLC